MFGFCEKFGECTLNENSSILCVIIQFLRKLFQRKIPDTDEVNVQKLSSY